MDKLKYKTFKIEHNDEIEYVQVLDKIDNKYLVVVVGEPANCYKDGKRYKTDYTTDPITETEIITPNMDVTFMISPEDIIKMVNK